LEELKRLREEKGWSQTKLAQESGVDRATINQAEGGRRSPTISTLELLATALGAEVADFFPKVQAPLPLEVSAAWAPLLEKVLDAARQDANKSALAANRLFASEGTPQGISAFAEDEVRTELRKAGFPDELWEPLLWPLAEHVVELEQQLEAKEDEPAERLGTDTRMRQ
jgi:transcriptional regulator with XRE-family HTH domain